MGNWNTSALFLQRTMEAFLIILSATQLLYIAAIHTAAPRRLNWELSNMVSVTVWLVFFFSFFFGLFIFYPLTVYKNLAKDLADFSVIGVIIIWFDLFEQIIREGLLKNLLYACISVHRVVEWFEISNKWNSSTISSYWKTKRVCKLQTLRTLH